MRLGARLISEILTSSRMLMTISENVFVSVPFALLSYIRNYGLELTNESSQPTRVAMIGCGKMARGRVRRFCNIRTAGNCRRLRSFGCGICRNGQGLCRHRLAYAAQPARFGRSVERLPKNLDVAFIVTPHAYHYEQARACLEAELDVLLEKPMVVTADEAKNLIDVRDTTGRLLVISFNGSLSPQIRAAATLLRSGELGAILSVVAFVGRTGRTATRDTGSRTLKSLAAVYVRYRCAHAEHRC